MSNRKKYVSQASFRGVPFEVSEDQYAGGRRNETHEFMGAEKPMTEDLGRKARDFSLQAFVVGPDWQSKRDALIEALETRGPGMLIHPNGKSYWVCAAPFTVREDTRLFIANFELKFIEAGEQPAPDIATDLWGKLSDSARALNIANDAHFASLSLPYISASVQYIGDMVKSFTNGIMGLINTADSLVDSADNIINTVISVVDDVVDITAELYNVAEHATDLLKTPDIIAAKIRAACDIAAAIMPMTNKSVAAAFNTSDDGCDLSKIDRTTDNGLAHYSAAAMTRNMAIANSMSIAALLLADIDFRNFDDAMAVNQMFNNAADTILSAEIYMTPEFTTAVNNLRADVHNFIESKAGALADEKNVTLSVETPARVLAWDLFGNSDRASEIVTMNGIKNPTFIPAGIDIKVLSK